MVKLELSNFLEPTVACKPDHHGSSPWAFQQAQQLEFDDVPGWQPNPGLLHTEHCSSQVLRVISALTVDDIDMQAPQSRAASGATTDQAASAVLFLCAAEVDPACTVC
eukprot:6041878-Amphidinium_carterae.2